MALWTPKPLLVAVSSLQAQIDETFAAAQKQLRARFPDAEVDHVGSTALAAAFTRRIIDIDMALDSEQVALAQQSLAQQPITADSGLKLNIQVRARKAPKTALRIRQTLAEHPILLGEYRGLQKQYLHRIGAPYPQAKKRFFDDLVQSSAFEQAGQPILPYRIQLKSDRLELHSAAIGDAEEFVSYLRSNKDNFEKHAGTRPDSYYELSGWQTRFAGEAVCRWRKEQLTLLLRTTSTAKLIGAIHVSEFVWGAFQTCNIGYQIDKSHEGQGYMHEGCKAAIQYLRSTWEIHRIQAAYTLDNERSANLAKRLGMRVVGRANDHICVNGSWHDSEIAELLVQQA